MPPRHEPSIPDSSIDPPEISVHSTGTSPTDDDIARLVASACLGHPGLEQPEYARSSSHPSNVPIGTRPRSVTMNTPCRRNLDPSVDFPGNRSPSEAASLLSGFQGLRAPPSTHSSYNPWNKSGTLLEGPGACSNLSAHSQPLPAPSHDGSASYMERVALYPGDSDSEIWRSNRHPAQRKPQVNFQELVERFGTDPRTKELEVQTFSDGSTKMSVKFRESPPYSQEPTPVMRAEEFRYRQPQGQHSGHVYPEGTGGLFAGYTPGSQPCGLLMGPFGDRRGPGYATIAESSVSVLRPSGISALTQPSVSVVGPAKDLAPSSASGLSGMAPEFIPGAPYASDASGPSMDNNTNQQGRSGPMGQPKEGTEQGKDATEVGAGSPFEAYHPALSDPPTISASHQATYVESRPEQAEEAAKPFLVVRTGASRDNWRARGERRMSTTSLDENSTDRTFIPVATGRRDWWAEKPAGMGSKSKVSAANPPSLFSSSQGGDSMTFGRGRGRGRGYSRGRRLYQHPRGGREGGDGMSMQIERRSRESSVVLQGPAGSDDVASHGAAPEVQVKRYADGATRHGGYIGRNWDPDFQKKKAEERAAKEAEEAKGKK